MSEKKAFDRSKFKGAKVAANKASVEESVSKNASNRGGRAGYMKIGEGKTVIRIACPHDENRPALQPICKAWLPRLVEKDGKKEVKNMPIFSATHHSPLGKDIIDAYIDFTMKMVYKENSKDEAKKKLGAITGYRDKTGKWVSGIRPQLSWDAYGWKGDGGLERVNLNKTVVDRMNELSIDEEADDPITVDPFSDPDTGVSLILEFDSKADSTKKWKVNKGTKPKPLTDDQLKELSDAEPLYDMLHNAYTREDFKHALEGLRIFDETNKYGTMEMEEFVSIIEEFQEAIDNCEDMKDSNKQDDDANETNTTKPSAKSTPTSKPKVKDPVEPSAEDDGLEDLDLGELKEYIEENELDIVVKAAYSKSKVISLIRAKIAEATSEVETEEEDDDLPFKATKGKAAEAVVSNTTGKESYKEKMDRIKRENDLKRGKK